MSACSIPPCDQLRKALPDCARAQLDEILSGQFSRTEVALLYHLLPPDRLAPVLLCLPNWSAAPELLRECIRHFWKVDNRAILQAPGFSLKRAREMFRQAQFPLPPDIPPMVKVWRGTSGKTIEQACEGLCWTLARDAACWFATLYENREPGDPIVVTASIQRTQILFVDQDDGFHESEVVLDRISDGDIDLGDEVEWQERAKQFIQKRKQAG